METPRQPTGVHATSAYVNQRKLTEPMREVVVPLPQLWKLDGDTSRWPWAPLADGVDIYVLYGEPERDGGAALYRHRGGGRIPRHRHQHWEHTLVLQGSQSDELAEYLAGTLVLREPGSEHTVVSSDGCIALVMWGGAMTAGKTRGAER